MFVGIECARDADNAHGGRFQRERLARKEPFELPVNEGRFLPSARTRAFLREVTAIPRKELVARRETVHREAAVIAAAAAKQFSLNDFARIELCRIEVDFRHCRAGAFHGNQRCAVGAHQSGDVRPNNGAADLLLKSTQNGVIEKRAALNDDVFAELCRIVNAQHFVERISDN